MCIFFCNCKCLIWWHPVLLVRTFSLQAFLNLLNFFSIFICILVDFSFAIKFANKLSCNTPSGAAVTLDLARSGCPWVIGAFPAVARTRFTGRESSIPILRSQYVRRYCDLLLPLGLVTDGCDRKENDVRGPEEHSASMGAQPHL